MDHDSKIFYNVVKNSMQFYDEIRIKNSVTPKNDKHPSRPISKSLSNVQNKIMFNIVSLKLNSYFRVEPIFIYVLNKNPNDINIVSIQWCWSIPNLSKNLIKYSLELFLYTVNLNNSYIFLKELLLHSKIELNKTKISQIKYRIIVSCISYFFKPFNMIAVGLQYFPEIQEYCNTHPIDDENEYLILCACYEE